MANAADADLNDFNTTSPVIATFSINDIRSGTGFQDYYLIQTFTNAVGYALTPNQDLSANPSALNISDEDYDLSPFVITQTIKGTARISVPVWHSSPNTFTLGVSFYSVTGGVETIIGSEVVFSKSVSTSSQMVYMTSELPRTVIPVGSQLRVRIRNPGGGSNAKYGTDPAGRTDGDLSITTTSKMSIPYENTK
jgi:hypothetical protein